MVLAFVSSKHFDREPLQCVEVLKTFLEIFFTIANTLL